MLSARPRGVSCTQLGGRRRRRVVDAPFSAFITIQISYVTSDTQGGEATIGCSFPSPGALVKGGAEAIDLYHGETGLLRAVPAAGQITGSSSQATQLIGFQVFMKPSHVQNYPAGMHS